MTVRGFCGGVLRIGGAEDGGRPAGGPDRRHRLRRIRRIDGISFAAAGGNTAGLGAEGRGRPRDRLRLYRGVEDGERRHIRRDQRRCQRGRQRFSGLWCCVMASANARVTLTGDGAGPQTPGSDVALYAASGGQIAVQDPRALRRPRCGSLRGRAHLHRRPGRDTQRLEEGTP